MTVVLVF